MAFAEDAGKAYEAGIKYNPQTAIPDLLTGGALSKGVGNATKNILGSFGLGGTKRWTNTGDWASRGISRVGQDAYNKYGDLLNIYNTGRAQDDLATDGRALGKDYVKKRTLRHGTRTRAYDVYGLRGDTGNYAMDQYKD